MALLEESAMYTFPDPSTARVPGWFRPEETSVTTAEPATYAEPPCVTVKLCPPMVKVPERTAAPPLASKVNWMMAFPVPLVLPAARCSQVALLCAVQLPDGGVIEKSTVSAPAAGPSTILVVPRDVALMVVESVVPAGAEPPPDRVTALT